MELPTQYQQFIHLSRYARWLPETQRRETWDETVNRYRDFFIKRVPNKLFKEFYEAIEMVRNLEVMPSMRCLMTAGPALERDNVAGYNCAYAAIDDQRVFDEIMYILMCGTGVGFSAERQEISKLPPVPKNILKNDVCILTPRDSKIGWCESFRALISLLYQGIEPTWNLGKIRPAGAKLMTFGGRASGPDPLDQLFVFTVNLFRKAVGRKLNSLECHDLACKIADIVVVGGVRRSALISLSNLSDDRMRLAKSGNFGEENPQRHLANNSAVYEDDVEYEVFLKEWMSLYASKSGERGIFSREACKRQAAKNGRRDWTWEFGTNPCSEIILRSNQFCNLTEAIVRPGDNLETLRKKVRAAALLGTLQSTLDNFRYVRDIWKENTQAERLLGVSLTGICDHKQLSDPEECYPYLTQLKQVAVDTNWLWAVEMDIEPSTAITCVKPSGTVSQLVDCSSGIHPRFSEYYVRTVRADNKDPLCQMMIDQGFPHEPCVSKPESVEIFSFPMKAPKASLYGKEMDAMYQLELWKVYQEIWCEHKPSCTIYYKDSEFLEVGNWVWNNLKEISGISFMPHSDHIYEQPPYRAIDGQTYHVMSEQMPANVDWSKLSDYESEDNTTGSQEYACNGSVCEINSIGSV